MDLLLDELKRHYPHLKNNTINLKKNNDNTLEVIRGKDKTYEINYCDNKSLIRGFSYVIAGEQTKEKCDFNTAGLMIDVSRNAVFKVSYLKELIRYTALMGYNKIMLYMEDVYEIEDEPFFGYMRGKYTKAELKEIVYYSKLFKVELIPCIQTLGHMGQFLRWDYNSKYKDTNTVLYVNKEETYELIDKMIRTLKDIFETDIIHIGMDEAHDLGYGYYIRQKGYKKPSDLFNEHLDKVIKICKKHNFNKPMIWSDMYYRMGSKYDDYYDMESVISQGVINKVPKDVELIYWDYYHEDLDFYNKMINNHKKFDNKIVMASGIWTWAVPVYEHERTKNTVLHAINSSRSNEIKDIYFTMWGDDGQYCDFNTSLLGLYFVSENLHSDFNDETINKHRFEVLTGYKYDELVKISQINITKDLKAAGIMWDDPLYGINFNNQKALNGNVWSELESHYENLSQELMDMNDKSFSHNHGYLLAKYLYLKIRIRNILEAKYIEDKDSLNQLYPEIDEIILLIEMLLTSYRDMWLKRYKPFGLEVIQTRLGGMIQRYKELKLRINELIVGEIKNIPELEEDTGKYQFIKWHHEFVNSSTIDR